MFQNSDGGFIGSLMNPKALLIILCPFVVATILLCIRIALESVMIIFRIGEHLKNIDEKT